MNAANPIDELTNPGMPADLPGPSGRPSWSGLLLLHLVAIPLKAFPAVRQRQTTPFHQLHADCGQRIRCPKHCPLHGAVDVAKVVRAYEYGPGRHIVVADAELDALRPAQDRALRLEGLTAAGECDPLWYAGRSLYLVPDGAAAGESYAVLQAALRARGLWGLGRMVLGGQRQVVLVRPSGSGLVLHVLHYPEQVRACPALGSSVKSSSQALALAGLLLDAVGRGSSWSGYRDETASELRSLVEAKLSGGAGCGSEPSASLLPLLEALQRSLAAARASAPGASSLEVEEASASPRRRRAEPTAQDAAATPVPSVAPKAASPAG